MITTTFPGVYIEEQASLSLSVNAGATAVPVFAVGEKADPDNTRDKEASENGAPKHFFEKTTRISSWLDFLNVLTWHHTKKKENICAYDAGNPLHLAVQAYFLNGGGYCYLVRAKSLLAEVPKLDDVTLLVAAGVGTNFKYKVGDVEVDFTDKAARDDFNKAVTTLCVPGASLFAVLDGPDEEVTKSFDMKDYSESGFAAVYYPYLNADWAKSETHVPVMAPVPPSGAVAGAYCSVDRERGVWKAPANVSLKGGLQPIYKVSDSLQGQFNSGKALNMIREFKDRGTLIWGARTLDDSDAWRYVPVRRLFNSAEKDIKKAMSFAVFEPNNEPTWERVRSSIDNYLRQLWQQGGLLGNSEKEAYFVQVGKGITMTDDDIQQGKMIVKVGMAAVRPAEFIILQFSQDVNQG